MKSATDFYDEMADLFKLDTGYTAIGKDRSPAMGEYTIEQEAERMKLWNVWCKAFNHGIEWKP